jgi:hypothetical protein
VSSVRCHDRYRFAPTFGETRRSLPTSGASHSPEFAGVRRQDWRAARCTRSCRGGTSVVGRLVPRCSASLMQCCFDRFIAELLFFARADIERPVVRMTTDNPTWGYTGTEGQPARQTGSGGAHVAQTRDFWRDNQTKREAKIGHVARVEPTTPARLLEQGIESWRRGWDSNFHASNGICNLQILKSRRCRKCQRCRRALPAIARWLSSPSVRTNASIACYATSRTRRFAKRKLASGPTSILLVNPSLFSTPRSRELVGVGSGLFCRVAGTIVGTTPLHDECPRRCLSCNVSHCNHSTHRLIFMAGVSAGH